jgi:hypothetical protein
MSSTRNGNEHLRHEVLVCGGSNTLFNGLSAWLLMKGGGNLQWSGDHSFVTDVLATAFLLPFIVGCIVIPLQRSKLSKGKLQPIDLGASSLMQSLADHFPANTLKSAVLLGLVGLLIIAPLTLTGLYLFGVQTISPEYYAIFKGIWAGLMASLLVVPMLLIALRENTSTGTTATHGS